jgi:hypothetical protein
LNTFNFAGIWVPAYTASRRPKTTVRRNGDSILYPCPRGIWTQFQADEVSFFRCHHSCFLSPRRWWLHGSCHFRYSAPQPICAILLWRSRSNYSFPYTRSTSSSRPAASSRSAGAAASRGGVHRFALDSRTRHTRRSSTRARTGCSTCKSDCCLWTRNPVGRSRFLVKIVLIKHCVGKYVT